MAQAGRWGSPAGWCCTEARLCVSPFLGTVLRAQRGQCLLLIQATLAVDSPVTLLQWWWGQQSQLQPSWPHCVLYRNLGVPNQGVCLVSLPRRTQRFQAEPREPLRQLPPAAGVPRGGRRGRRLRCAPRATSVHPHHARHRERWAHPHPALPLPRKWARRSGLGEDAEDEHRLRHQRDHPPAPVPLWERHVQLQAAPRHRQQQAESQAVFWRGFWVHW